MLTILQGDALEKLSELPDESVQCCVTSPPYWGLRDYGTATWEGGDDTCDHKQFLGGNGELSAKQVTSCGTQQYNYRSVCGKCGARRIDSQIGLEETPEAYVAKMVQVFREFRRVMRDDGTLWMNLGDSYASDVKGSGGYGNSTLCMDGRPEEQRQRTVLVSQRNQHMVPRRFDHGLKPKDLCGIPWMVAFALRADGWYLRSDIIWHKPNPMPESVTDRPTKAHEYLFLLSKRQSYFYNADAIKEPHARLWDSSNGGNWSHKERFPKESAQGNHSGGYPMPDLAGRNKRSVWTVATAPYSEAHFATYPPDLIKPCILAGTKAGDTVLDPFAGSGTTGMVAIELGRKALLIELNPAYIELIEKRCSTTLGMAL